MTFNLARPFFSHASSAPDRVALRICGNSHTYGELAHVAQSIRDWAWSESPEGPRRVAIVGGRSAEAYQAILGICWSGAAYIPISPKLPQSRLNQVLEIINPDAILADAEGMAALSGVGVTARPVSDFEPSANFREPDVAAGDSPAYVIFTSGSTGVPKGVVVELAAVHHYLEMMRRRYNLGPEDRVAQPCELGFDVSMSNIFMAWQAGAALAAVSTSQAMAPRDFILAEQPTFWFSTPATGVFMDRLSMLRPGIFPSLRYSAFAGDVLPVSLAERWQSAAPNSVVENLYGPTEATVICAGTTCTDPEVVTESRSIISIGKELPGTDLIVADEDGNPLPRGQSGELLIGGDQLARGYWNDAALTARKFPTIAGKRWYRSGDLVYQDANGLFHHLGRLDDQVKIRGYRVELGEIEAHLREVCSTNAVAAVPWPVRQGAASGIVGFVSGSSRSIEEVQQALKDRLPSHLVPSQIRTLDELPIGLTGKLDRRGLVALLEAEA